MTPEEIRAVHAPNFQAKVQAEMCAQIIELKQVLTDLLTHIVKREKAAKSEVPVMEEPKKSERPVLKQA
jgi:hypothetical protein